MRKYTDPAALRRLTRIKTYLRFLLPAMILLAAGWGCTTRRIGGKGVYLKKVIVKCDNPDISKEEVYGYVKQKPNRKLIGINLRNLYRKDLLVNGSGFPFYLHIHNLVGPKHEARRQARRDAHYKKRSERYDRLSPDKKAKRNAPKKRRTVGEFLLDIGEAPVLLDSEKTNRSMRQMELYLNNKGYFNSIVRDTVTYPFFFRKNKKKGTVTYIIEPSQPYRIRNITWKIDDPGIAYDIQTDTSADKCLLKKGGHYDIDTFAAEQMRITNLLRNNGYYQFSKDYVRFTADTSLGSNQADVEISIRRPQVRINDTSWVDVNHRRFTVRYILVKNIYSLAQMKKDTMSYDTIHFNDIVFLRNTDSLGRFAVEPVLRYRPEVIAQRVAFHSNIYYRQSDFDATYRQLSGLRVFRQVVISPEEAGPDKIDIVIKLMPVKKQSYTTQIEGTNTGGNLGVSGALSYQNTNLYHGAEILDIRIKGGTEAQQALVTGTTENNSQLAFNTIEIGTDASLYIPREFFPFGIFVSDKKTEENRKAQERRTVFTTSFNYQRRVDYDRLLWNLSYGYTYRFGNYQRIGIYPVELNVVKVNPKEGLQQLLQGGDPLLVYRFTDHLIHDFRVTYVWNTQGKKKDGATKQKHINYLKADFEMAGNALYAGYELAHADTDDNGSYRLAGIPFAQYIRLYLDYNHHFKIGDYEEIVIRVAQGIGVPIGNFPTLPLEKSFYGGGANGLRAWEARSVGPGSYVIPPDQRYAQFGDVQMEYNIEMRFRITSSLNGAVFADGGNIWLLKKDDQREGASFSKTFYNDFAFGPGIGVRYDLSFFVVRLDWAFKLRDPAQPYGERWYIPGQRRLDSNLNFGIGYPF